MSTSSRLLAVCIFSDEKTTSPKGAGPVPWSKIVEEHQKRRTRQNKSGVMLGGYQLNGTRANDNVPYRSLIQLDIDTRGEKDKLTGRILTVTKPAPPLDQVRLSIGGYEWCAASSHWHEPGRGVIKYRIVILPDRDIKRDEWEPLLEALDERLGGALDREAWQWSQAFYLPSCPPENEGDAFSEHHEGEPLPVGEFVRRGREIIAAKKGAMARLSTPADASGAAGGNILDFTRPPPPVEEMRAVLSHLASRGCFEHRTGIVTDDDGCIVKVGWIETGMALKPAYGDEVGFDLWSVTHIDDQARADAPGQWASFAAEPQRGHVTIATIIKAARDAGFNPPSFDAPSGVRDGAPATAAVSPATAAPMKAAMEQLNARYFVAKVGGGVFVFDEDDRNILTDAMSFASFRQFHAGRKINGKSVAADWLSSPGRRTCKSLVFDPSGHCAEGNYNTWRGLAVGPKKGQCGKILAHIRDVLCGGDDAQFEYVLKWMALLVQKPWIKPEVALVLRSRQGSGKTMIVQILLDIFGVHSFTTAQKDQVAGRFNGHLFDKVLVVLEEAFFAGDPAAVATAKALVTNRTLGYEAKGKDAFSAPNYAHVITLTNHDWAVPAGADARRWLVLDVSEARLGDHAYFSALAEEIANGGTEAFLDHLMKVDLCGFNSRAMPRTRGLQSQQVETLEHTDPAAAFLMRVLAEGEFPVEGGGGPWADRILAGELRESYTVATRGAETCRRLMSP